MSSLVAARALDAPEPRRRERVRDQRFSYVRTEEAAGHVHCCAIGPSGSGWTSTAPDGHRHLIRDLELLPAAGHTHELSEHRCLKDHDGEGGCT